MSFLNSIIYPIVRLINLNLPFNVPPPFDSPNSLFEKNTGNDSIEILILLATKSTYKSKEKSYGAFFR